MPQGKGCRYIWSNLLHMLIYEIKAKVTDTNDQTFYTCYYMKSRQRLQIQMIKPFAHVIIWNQGKGCRYIWSNLMHMLIYRIVAWDSSESQFVGYDICWVIPH